MDLVSPSSSMSSKETFVRSQSASYTVSPNISYQRCQDKRKNLDAGRICASTHTYKNENDQRQDHSQSLQTPRQRSRRGCYTCRRRKKRCNEAKPVCEACVRLKLECLYPTPGQERKNKKRKKSDEYVNSNSKGVFMSKSDIQLPLPSVPSLLNSEPLTSFNKHSKLHPTVDESLQNKQKNPKRDSFLSQNSSPDHSGLHSFSSFDSPGLSPDAISEFDDTLLPKLDFKNLNRRLNTNSSSRNDQNDGAWAGLLNRTLSSSNMFSFDTNPSATPNPSFKSTTSYARSSANATISSCPSPLTAALAGISSSMFNNDFSSDSLHQHASTYQVPQTAAEPEPKFHSPQPSHPPITLFPQKLISSLLSSPFLTASQSLRIEELCDDGNLYSNPKDKGKLLHSLNAQSTDRHSNEQDSIPFHSKPANKGNNCEKNNNDHQLEITFNNGSNFQVGESSQSPGSILRNPKPWYYLHLDSFGVEMFAYYNNHLANMICVSSKINSFINIFVPMAEQDRSVLYALVAYASFHHTMGRYEDVGLSYLNKAIQMVRRDLPKHQLTTLASILIIVTAEICKGDMVHWNRHLTAAADVIQMRGGIKNFTNDPTKRWLATNFVYHDLLAASKYKQKPHFEPKEYENILNMDEGVHTLLGCCKPVFGLLAEISDLTVEAQEVYAAVEAGDTFSSSCNPASADSANDSANDVTDSSKFSFTPDSLFSKFQNNNSPKTGMSDAKGNKKAKDPSSSSDDSSFSEYLKTKPVFSQRRISDRVRDLYHHVELLEAKIDSCKPDPNDILSLSKSKCDLEEQLTLFETFQLTAKIHLYQSICRRNAACLQLQVLTADLITSLDVILNTKVEGSLLFPLFIAAISSTTVKRRTEIVARFDLLYKRQLARNIVRALNLAEEVWKLDDNGEKYVNWYKVLEKNGWDICFA